MPRLFALAVAAAALAAAPARADFRLQLTNAGAPTLGFTTTVGGTVVVGVYLVETGGTVLRTDGLLSAGVGLTPAPSGVGQVTAVGVNPLFTITSTSFDPPNGGGFSGDVDFTDPAVTSDVADPTRLFLGTFTLTGVAPGTTTLTARDRTPGAGTADFVTGTGASLDGGLAFGSASFTVSGPAVSAVPLPATGLASALAACLVLGLRPRVGAATPRKA